MATENGPGYSGYSYWKTVNGVKMRFVSPEEAREYKEEHSKIANTDTTEAEIKNVQDVEQENEDSDNEEGVAEAGQEN